QIAAAHHVQNDIDPAAAGLGLDDTDEVVALVIDRPLRAELLAEATLLLVPRRRKHSVAESGRELDGEYADAARSAVHEQRLAGLQSAELEDIAPDGECSFGERGGLDHREGAWNGQHLPFVHRAMLRVAAALKESTDAVADAELPHFRTHGRDGAGDF